MDIYNYSLGEKMSNEPTENSVEVALRQFLHPVTPRHEFVSTLKDKLEETVLPIQKRKTVSFYTLIDVFLRTVSLLVLAVLTVRALMVIITTWKLMRFSNIR
ncbi:MAG: hypothetical protein Kow0088_05880 [Anaerolineales bacterium]